MMGDDASDAAHGFGAAFAEHHSGAGVEILGVLDEFESAGGFVSRSQMLLVHGDDGGSLPRTATVYYCTNTIISSSLSDTLYA